MGAVISNDNSLDARLRQRTDELSKAFADTEEGRNVSDFWRKLVSVHLALVETQGFQRFKQTLNFKYSQWCVTAPVDPRLWRMLYTFGRELGVPKLWRQAEYRGELPRWPIPSPGARHLYKMFVATLWEYVQRHDSLEILRKVEEPALGGPIPLYSGATLLSQDLALSTLEVNRICQYIELNQIKSVLEIGGGYGRLGYVFRKLLPDVEYHIVDIPPALAVSELYLTTLFGTSGLHFHLPAALASLPNRHFDVVLNVSSFDEMKATQAQAYLSAFADKARGIAYIKGHGKRDHSTGRRGVLELDYPPGWRELFRGGDPFQHTFRELVFTTQAP